MWVCVLESIFVLLGEYVAVGTCVCVCFFARVYVRVCFLAWVCLFVIGGYGLVSVRFPWHLDAPVPSSAPLQHWDDACPTVSYLT